MKKIEENNYKFKTLYPDSIISKKHLNYKKTNEDLNSFLFNNFSVNSSNNNSKFPINSPQNKKNPIKRYSNSILKERSGTSKKSNKNIFKLIDSLKNENYISYNYYDNTKGRLQSAKTRNNNILKQKISNISNNNNSINFSKINKSKKFSVPSKFRLFKSSSLFKPNAQKKKLIFDNNDSTNLNSFSFNNFSFNNYIISHRSPLSNNSKNTSRPQSHASSTRYKNNIKKNSLKLEYDSLILNNNLKNDTRKSVLFSYEMKKRIQQHLKNNIIKSIKKRKLHSANLKLSKEQRKFHQKLFLDRLLSQVQSFEKSNDFYVDDLKLRTNLITPNKFQRNKFIKKVKRAAKHNDFFFKKYHFQPDKDQNFKKKQFKIRSLSPKMIVTGGKAKTLLYKIKNLKKKTKISIDYIKNLDFRLGTKKLKKIVGIVIPIEHKVRDIDEQYKKETVKYQKSIGNFVIYKGSGIYSNHLSSILRGDKIVAQAIKIEDL